MSTDYHTAQGDFSSIVYRLQPMVLSNFVMWLDLKVAEFKVYGQMLLDEQDSNASKWFLQTGLGQDVPPYAKQKKRPSMHTGSTERTKRLATTIVSKPIKHSRIDISDEEENIELKSKSILPLDTSPLQEDFREFQEQVNSFISSSDNQVFQSSSPSSQTSAKTKMITNNNSSIQRDEKHSDQHNIAKHVKKSNSAGSDIMQFHSADSSLSSDFSNISRPTSETSSQKLLSVLPQTSQYDSSHSQNITTCTSSSSTILPPSDTKPVVKIEPDDSEYNQLKMENLEQFSEMPSEDNSSSMYLVPNISVAGETNTDISSRTHTVTHSDGAMYFSTPSDNENLQTDDKSASTFCDSILNTSDNTVTEVLNYNQTSNFDWPSGKHNPWSPHSYPITLDNVLQTQENYDQSVHKNSCSGTNSTPTSPITEPKNYYCKNDAYVTCKNIDSVKQKPLRHVTMDNDFQLSLEPTEHRKMRQWRKEDMEKAVLFYKNQQILGYKVSIRQLAERFSVPKSTLSYQILNHSRLNQTNVKF